MKGFEFGLSTLGTDDQAVGSPNTPEQVAMARALEKRGAPKLGRPALWIIVGVFAALLAMRWARPVWTVWRPS